MVAPFDGKVSYVICPQLTFVAMPSSARRRRVQQGRVLDCLAEPVPAHRAGLLTPKLLPVG
jgi:hypothetical protein